jgi:hypothetical protein
MYPRNASGLAKLLVLEAQGDNRKMRNYYRRRLDHVRDDELYELNGPTHDYSVPFLPWGPA